MELRELIELMKLGEQRQSPVLSEDSRAPKEGATHPHGHWHGASAAGWHR